MAHKATRTKKEDGWFSTALAARAFGVDVRAFTRNYAPLAEQSDVRRVSDNRLEYYVRSLIDALVRREVAAAAAVAGGPDAELLGGGDSPNLERLRLAKAQIAEIELQERRKDIIPRAQVHDLLTRVSVQLRRAGEILQRQWGEDAQQVLDEALTELRGELEKEPQ